MRRPIAKTRPIERNALYSSRAVLITYLLPSSAVRSPRVCPLPLSRAEIVGDVAGLVASSYPPDAGGDSGDKVVRIIKMSVSSGQDWSLCPVRCGHLESVRRLVIKLSPEVVRPAVARWRRCLSAEPSLLASRYGRLTIDQLTAK